MLCGFLVRGEAYLLSLVLLPAQEPRVLEQSAAGNEGLCRFLRSHVSSWAAQIQDGDLVEKMRIVAQSSPVAVHLDQMQLQY